MLREYLSTLANAFRSKLGTTEKINARSFPDKVTEVYNAGYNIGYNKCLLERGSKLIAIDGGFIKGGNQSGTDQKENGYIEIKALDDDSSTVSSEYERNAYIKFDLSFLKGYGFNEAILNLQFKENITDRRYNIYMAEKTNWTSTNLTANNAPAIRTNVNGIKEVYLNNNVKTVDISSFVRKALDSGDTELTIIISTTKSMFGNDDSQTQIYFNETIRPYITISEIESGGSNSFFNVYQDYGNRTNCIGMFMGDGWNRDTMKPNWSIVAKQTYMMFAYCGYDGDLADVFDNRDLSLTFDLSTGSANQGYLFYQSKVKAVGTVDLSSITETSNVSSMFNSAYLETIRELIPPQCEMGETCWGAALINLSIGGAITKTFNLLRCTKLTDESADSVIEHLADLTGGTTQTLIFAPAVGNRLTQEQKALISARNWELVY